MFSVVTTEGEFTVAGAMGYLGRPDRACHYSDLLDLTRYIIEFYLGTHSSEKLQKAKKKELVRDTVKAIKKMGSPVK